MTGADTMILMDGKPLKGCCAFMFEVEADGVAKVTMELVGTFSMTAEIGELQTIILPLVPKKDNA